MLKIDFDTISNAVYELCVQANTLYPQAFYDTVCEKYKNAENCEKQKLYNILKNAQIASKNKRPLCQDTGQVVVFVEIGKNVLVNGVNVEDAVNDGVKRAYTENFYRKSVVKNSLFDRTNTNTNTPAIVYVEFTNTDKVSLKLLIKGAGSENYSAVKMFKPSCDKTEIFEFVKNSIVEAGEKSCPPLVLGIGAGGTMDKAAVLSKKAFFNENLSSDEKRFVSELKNYLSDLSKDILDIKIQSASTHIACLPVALTINCHSTRHASCEIKKDGVKYFLSGLAFDELKENNAELKEIHADDIEQLRNLKPGESFFLSGEIYTARDAAHAKLFEEYQKTKSMTFDFNNKIIFYAGPCPAAEGEVIGPIGPTTSARMDKFCEFMHSNGLLASIGKGERSKDAVDTIKRYGARYFTVQGGIACLLSKCVKQAEITAFEELGTEAVRKLYVEKLPVKVEV